MVSIRKLTSAQILSFFVGTLGVLVLAQLVILIVWSAVDPFRSTRVTVNAIDLTVNYVCTANTPWIWMGIEIGYFALLLVWGVYLLYRTWDISTLS